ncbi:MAG: carbohydrate binding family 9 domain-containing protein [Candidatus Marinimicrobia bacterium]|nr:carbohydrate binding family 9 domain-containing protein [Candidatus Neomarinimicrobiota bacterium]MBT3676995.1 carbohydrate binding family 9 domain-containing protein [Candidatus Neomarinimicrobiota bacterium]MBT4068943.1 carbohydrate binding family 9 domain-containing protein [Candidatus Neomarinimicrobiota bacterium]MBT4271371.1 carbohydrate binding family 9 domain-containing protein [Candidatus Neomarinimicrobiota bacterium]MBT4372983.1 carbohydrate binding family 9 domain-containing prot
MVRSTFRFILIALCIIYGQGRPEVIAIRTDETIKIDGILDEAVWETINPITEFVQRLPLDGGAPTEKSEMRVAYNNDFIYFGFTFYDSEPEKVRATILNRGGWIHRDDKLEIALDTYHDRRNAYLFEMNPLGTQDDALISDENRPGLDEWAWDGVYISEGKVTDFGWVLEVAIPWTTLRFPSKDELTMGLAIKRYINRKNESVMWPHIGLNYSSDIYQVSQYADLKGLKHIKRGKDIKIKPFAIGGTQNQLTDEKSVNDNIGNGGFDIYYGLKSNLTMNLTYNTDFAQVEADNAQINLTRFNLFYPEKREFFLTRSKLFAFGNSRQTEVFFSRKIGLNQDVVGGARMFGQVGNTSVGALNIHTRGNGEAPATHYSAIRLRKDVRDRTTVGVILTDVASKGVRNSVYGIDGQMRFWGSSSISAWYSRVKDIDYTQNPYASMVKIDLKNDRYFLTAGQHRVGSDFKPLLGFVQRNDMVGTGALAGFTPRVGQGDKLIRQLRFTVYGRDVRSFDGVKQTETLSGGIDAILESRDRIGVKFSQDREFLDYNFTLGNGVEINKGNYKDRKISFSARTNQSRGVWGNLSISKGNYFGGNKTSVFGSIGKQFSNHLTLYGSANQNIIFMPSQGEFTANVYGFTAEVALNRRWFGKGSIQYDNFSEQLQLYCRINWIHTPGSDLFIVLNQRYDISGKDRQLIQGTQVVKLTYLFQI